jgi:DHA1 family tetracycline resistance protein-like MFS transporter
MLGVLSDRYGRRPVLLLSLAGSTIDYLVMAFTPYLWLLFAGRALAGLTSATTAMATAYITDITPEAQRARRFGLSQAFFGAGFVAGPVIGGMLGDISVRDPFLFAAALNGLNLAIVLFVLPESHRPEGKPPHRKPPHQKPIDWRVLNPLMPLRWALAFPALLPLLAVFALISLGGQSYGTIWVLFGEDRFGWTETEVGLSLALFGALMILTQAFAVGPVTARLGERRTLLLGLCCEGVTLLVFAFAHAGWVAFAAIPLLTFGGIGLPALKSLQTRAVDPARQGELQGVASSLWSLGAILGPLLFGWIYAMSQPGWNGFVWITGVAIYVFAVSVVLALPRSAGRAPGRTA